MSLDRFQNFQASAAQSAPNGDPAHVRVEEHGAPASNRPSYVRRFLRKAWGVALVGAVGMGAMHLANHYGASEIGPLIGDDPVANGAYQYVERTVLGHQAGLDVQAKELKALDAKMQAAGVYTIRPTISVSYYHRGAADSESHVDGTCTIELSMDEQGRMTSLGIESGLMRSNDPEAIRNHRNFIYAHETEHCSFHEEMAPFRGSGMSAATEKLLNEWVFGATAPDDHNPAKALFNETQSDVVGELVMLREAKYSEAAWREVEHDWYDRQAKQRYEEAHQMSLAYDPHSTAPALREMLDHRDEVEKIAPGQFRDYAYRLATHSVMAQLNAARERATPGPSHPLDERLTSKDDPLRHQQTVMGPLGWDQLAARLNPVAMRITVSEQALRMREEQLGLRKVIQGVGNTLPRQMAQQWVAHDTPYKPITQGVSAVSFMPGEDGAIERKWLGKDGIEGKMVFYSAKGGAHAFRDAKAFGAFQQQVHWDAAVTEIKHALGADDASLAHLARTAPKHPEIDMGNVKPAVAAPQGATVSAQAAAPAPASDHGLPSLSQLGTRLDAAAHRVRIVATGLAESLPFRHRSP